jgi:hypothetical protein
VLILKGAYKGQKEIALVATNITANTNKITPKVPLTVPVKDKIAITAARIKRTIRSVVPMFGFI